MTAQAAAVKSSEAYDAVPYESFSYPQSHPAHLAALAALFNLPVPAVATARILELGCASGGNLFPIGLTYPKAQVFGIDLSQEQIALGQQQKEALKAKNVTLTQQDILDFKMPKGVEAFDYIICHGIFSWVPENVRDKILSICRDHLSDNGLALISYNALPGWNFVRSLREMMLYHTNRFTKPEEKITQARCLLEFLSENVPEGNAYRTIIDEERNLLKTINNTYLYHDHLEAVNAQFYLHDMVRLANDKDLAYVGDAALPLMFVGNMPPKAMETLKVLDDIVTQEQYMDFVSNRRFRSTILRKKKEPIQRHLNREDILKFGLTLNPTTEVDGADTSKTITFRVRGAAFATHDARASTLFLELAAAGRKPVMAEDLIARVQKKLNLPEPGPVRDVLVEHGMNMALRGFVGLRIDSPACAETVSAKPEAFALARFEAAQPGRSGVTNIMGETLPADLPARIVLQNLDGTKTMTDLANILAAKVKSGELKAEKNGHPITDEKELFGSMEDLVGQLLGHLARSAFLTA